MGVATNQMRAMKRRRLAWFSTCASDRRRGDREGGSRQGSGAPGAIDPGLLEGFAASFLEGRNEFILRAPSGSHCRDRGAPRSDGHSTPRRTRTRRVSRQRSQPFRLEIRQTPRRRQGSCPATGGRCRGDPDVAQFEVNARRRHSGSRVGPRPERIDGRDPGCALRSEQRRLLRRSGVERLCQPAGRRLRFAWPGAMERARPALASWRSSTQVSIRTTRCSQAHWSLAMTSSTMSPAKHRNGPTSTDRW